VMHLRGAQPGETCRLQATLYYASPPDAPDDDPATGVPPASEALEIERRVVDRREFDFTAGGEIAVSGTAQA
jgi:hypothetical protein